jgi:hypothetical protein
MGKIRTLHLKQNYRGSMLGVKASLEAEKKEGGRKRNNGNNDNIEKLPMKLL